jgi:uncharacterized membrane protein YfcA
MTAWLTLAALAYCQNIAFSVASRARNRNSATYHAIAAVFSNAVWFATFRFLVVADMSWDLFVPYTVGTVAGSLTGAAVSSWVEQKIGATT